MHQAHHDAHVVFQLAIFAGGKIIFHLLQFLGGHLGLLELFQLGVNALLQFGGCVAVLGLARDVKVARPFLGDLSTIHIVGHAAAQHQTLVKTAGLVGQKFAENFQRVGILVLERHGMPENVHLRIRVGLAVQAFLAGLFHFERHHVGN